MITFFSKRVNFYDIIIRTTDNQGLAAAPQARTNLSKSTFFIIQKIIWMPKPVPIIVSLIQNDFNRAPVRV